jgi:putative transposase
MTKPYTIRDQSGVYFVTFTVHQWVDVFTRNEYSEILIDNLNYCISYKGLMVFGWVIMSNHMHLIVKAKNENLSAVIRDFKKFTAKAIVKAIVENPAESRKSWLLFTLTRSSKIQFWQKGYHGKEIFSDEFFESKLTYIHENPVKAGIVNKEEGYILSSAGDYFGVRTGRIPISEY